MKALTTLLAVIILLAVSELVGQTTSPEFDDEYADQLQQKLENIGLQNGYKGLSAAVMVPGQGLWVGTWGQAAPNQPVTPNMRFGIASNSKAIIGALVLRLQDEGLLDIDDKISDYLPAHLYINGNITIRQLLTHTSGLFDFLNDWTAATQNAYFSNPDSLWTFDDLLATVGPPIYSPGIVYDYSNTNYLLAGMIAEAVTNEKIEDLLENKIFGPLDLNMVYPTSNFSVFGQPYSNVWNSSNELILDPSGSRTFLTFSSTAGAIWSTAYDMVRWYDALFSGHFLSPGSQYDLLDYDGYTTYGMGIRVRNIYGRSIYNHSGAWGFRSYMLHDPESGISLCLLSNLYGQSVTDVAQSLFLEAIIKRPKKEFDIVVKEIGPIGNICKENLFLDAVLFNKGTEPIHEAETKIYLNGDSVEHQYLFFNPPINPSEVHNMSFDTDFTFENEIMNQVEVSFILPDEDGYPRDNSGKAFFKNHGGDGISLPFYEGFEIEERFPNTFYSLSHHEPLNWRTSEFCSYSGQQCLARNNYRDGNVGAKYTFDLPMLKSNGVSPVLDFAYAHVSYTGDEKEVLKGYISTDCGNTFEELFVMTGNTLETAAPQYGLFLPTADQWENASVHLSDYAGENFIIRFELENEFGNNTYIDDIQINEIVTAVDEYNLSELKINPNPTSDFVQIEMPNELKKIDLELVNSYGQKVKEINVGVGEIRIKVFRNNLPAGIYFIKSAWQERDLYLGKIIFVD